MRVYDWKTYFSQEEMELIRSLKQTKLIAKMIETLDKYDAILCEMDAEIRDNNEYHSMDVFIGD